MTEDPRSDTAPRRRTAGRRHAHRSRSGERVPHTGTSGPAPGIIAVRWQDLIVHLTAVCAYTAAVIRLLARHRRVAVTVPCPTRALR